MMTTINCLANLITFVACTTFYINLYGDEHKVVHSWKILKHWTLRIALIFVSSSSLFFFLSCMSATIYETILNTGLAFFFIWVHKFHSRFFKNEGQKNVRKDSITTS